MDDGSDRVITRIPKQGTRSSASLWFAAAVGLMVLLGAGCARTQTVESVGTATDPARMTESGYPVMPDGTIIYPKSSTDEVAEAVDFSIDSVCLNGFDTYGDFLEELKKFQIEILPQDMSDDLPEDFADGWKIHKVCFTRALEISQMKFAFVFIKTGGVTADEAKSIVRAVSFEDQKLKPEDFKGENYGWSLMKFAYSGWVRYTFDESDTQEANMMHYSDVFAVNGGPNQLGYLENLSFVRDIQDKDRNIYLKAQTAGGDNDSYYADVEYRPKGKQGLTFKICTNVNYGEELGEDMRFTCQK